MTTQESWIQEELSKLKMNQELNSERKQPLKFEENTTIEFSIDASEPFKEWYDEENLTTKKIIPCKMGTEEYVWWLNVKNPVYTQIMEKIAEGQMTFKLMRTGKGKASRYVFVKN